MRFPLLVMSGLLLVASPLRAQTPPVPAQTPAPPPAQTPAPPRADNRIPVAALDARVVYTALGQDAITAASLQLSSAALLKSKTFGLMGGVHVYPIRGKHVALGLGGDAVLIPGNSQPEDPIKKEPVGPEIKRRVRGFSGQVSLNFGKRQGWSYITGGLGPTSFESYLGIVKGSAQVEKVPDGLRPMTLNAGGGARWFNFQHLAFSLDFRMYFTKEALATSVTAARGPKRLILLSGGISIK
jgi:hypothetical protein